MFQFKILRMPVALATTSSFSNASQEPRELLHSSDYELVLNPHKRKLTESELLELLEQHRPAALLAGLEPITRAVLEKAAPYLKVISRVGVGMENVDLTAAQELGMRVFRTEDVVSPAVAEFTVGLILALSRRIAFLDREMHKGHWCKTLGNTLAGKNLGILGCGKIGSKVIEYMKPFGIKPFVHDLHIDNEWCKRYEVSIVESVEQILKTSDIISIHLPSTPSTRGLLSREKLALLQPTSFLVNTSRADILDEKSLYNLLSGKQIAGAALDVFTQEPYRGPLQELDNVILTPHAATYAQETRVLMEVLAVKNILTGILPLKHKEKE